MTDDQRPDQHVRALLDETVSGVEPTPGLDAIRARTAGRPTAGRRPWLLGAGAAVLASAAVVVAVSLVGGTGPGPSGSAGPAGSATAGQTSATDGPFAAVEVYYLGSTPRGPRLYREGRSVSTADVLSGALDLAVGHGPQPADGKPQDPDYRVAWPAGTTARGTSDGPVTTVSLTNPRLDLRERPAGMTSAQADLAVQALVYTAQDAAQSKAPVRFELAGKTVGSVLGVTTTTPVQAQPPGEVLSQVLVSTPAEGVALQSGFDVKGEAAAFEANVQWELEQGGKVVKSGFTTARECCTLAPFSFTVQAPPGSYTLVVHDTDPSGKGAGTFQDTKDITITP